MAMTRSACVTTDTAHAAKVKPEPGARSAPNARPTWGKGFGHGPLPFFACAFPAALVSTGMPKHQPDFEFETAAAEHGFQRVVGVDEVGRGPWAGPVTSAAVILDPSNIPDGLNDSKLLSAKRREALYEQILSCAEVSVADVSVEEIDQHNILRASHLAMVRAIQGLTHPADYALIDGNMIPRGLNLPASAIVKGDQRSLSIAAASIVAKVWRDRLMIALAQQHPGYGWETNAGYGTPAHQEGLKCHGVTPHHRRSFKPIHNILYQAKNLSD